MLKMCVMLFMQMLPLHTFSITVIFTPMLQVWLIEHVFSIAGSCICICATAECDLHATFGCCVKKWVGLHPWLTNFDNGWTYIYKKCIYIYIWNNMNCCFLKISPWNLKCSKDVNIQLKNWNVYDHHLFAVYVGKYSTHPMNTGFPTVQKFVTLHNHVSILTHLNKNCTITSPCQGCWDRYSVGKTI